MIKHKDTGQN